MYLPSIEQRKEWEKLADEEGVSLSGWIVNNVEENLYEREEKGRSRK